MSKKRLCRHESNVNRYFIFLSMAMVFFLSCIAVGQLTAWQIDEDMAMS
jgi:hypothetical protein